MRAPTLLVSLALATLAGPVFAQQELKKLPRTPQAWSLDEALSQLEVYPRDRYLQYVTLQLARREGKLAEISPRVENIVFGEPSTRRAGRVNQVDLFSVFTGKLAVQESLQLDTLRAGQPGDLNPPAQRVNRSGEPIPPRKEHEQVPLDKLTGPTIKSHPWETMLKGRTPAVSRLSQAVPEDQYFVEFKSFGKFLDLAAASDLYGGYLARQSAQDASSFDLAARLATQLVLPLDTAIPLFEKTVKATAVTGSDLYLTTGSDVTLLFELGQPAEFKAAVEATLAGMEKARPDVKRTTGSVADIPYVLLSTPDRAVSAYSAWPQPDLHVRSNSLVGLTRVLSVLAGRNVNEVVKPLGAASEFRFIRTLMPAGAKEEDVFVYMSDAFIRRQVGPRVKLAERRRAMAHNHLRMISHGSLLFRTDFGRRPASLAELAATGCTPGMFNEGDLVCPSGGKYSLAADGLTGVSSLYGQGEFLTPVCELPLKSYTGAEADLYDQFLDEYNQYWRTFFDPIAIRVQVTPQKYRAETIVLPLIDNSIYSSMAQAFGGEPEPLDALPVPRRNMASLSARLNKAKLIEQANGFDAGMALGSAELRHTKLDGRPFLEKGIGNQISLHIYDAPRTFEFDFTGFAGRALGNFNGQNAGWFGVNEMFPIAMMIGSLNAPVYIAVPVKDAKIVDEFLLQLDPIMAELARRGERGGWWRVDQDYYQIPPQGVTPVVRCHTLTLGPLKWRFFHARIGNGLYLASKKFILDDLAAAHVARAKPGPEALPEDQGPTAHAMFRLRPNHWREVRPEFELSWAESNRRSSLNNLGPLSSIARAIEAAPPGVARERLAPELQMREVQELAERVYGVRFTCPEGGEYQLGSDRTQVVSSLFGTPLAPRQTAAPAAKSQIAQLLADLWQVTAELTFMEDGLHAVLTIDRQAPRK